MNRYYSYPGYELWDMKKWEDRKPDVIGLELYAAVREGHCYWKNRAFSLKAGCCIRHKRR